MNGALDGGVVLVTGAGRGIGRAVAEACACAGASVVAIEIDGRTVDETAAAIADRGGEAVVLTGDIADSAVAERAVGLARETFGGVSGLVNNAAVLLEADTVATTEEQWDRTLGVNLRGAWLMARAAIPAMLAGGAGAIVNVASIEAHSVRANHAAYVASKAGLIGLTKAIAIDYGRRGVRCNSISPGSIATDMFRGYVAAAEDPAALEAALIDRNYRGRLGTVEEIAAAVVFLLSGASGFTNGADLVIDGGRLSAT